MKLSIGNQPIALSLDAKISIEKTSPLLNDNTGSYSYPFPVPTPPNWHPLGWPGKLERAGEIPDKSFILEEQGIQVLCGEVDYDQVDENEIGIVLKSGATEFFARIAGQMLPSIDYGSEWWFNDATTLERINEKLVDWGYINADPQASYAQAPFLLINQNNTDYDFCNSVYSIPSVDYHAYMLQFKVWFILQKIFENFGYQIESNGLQTSEFKQLVVMTKPFYWNVQVSEENPDILWVFPVSDQLIYSRLMPDISIQDFLDGIKKLTGLVFLIDDQTKKVKIGFVRDIYLPENQDPMPITELKGWQHREHGPNEGYTISFQSQDDPDLTATDYIIDLTVESSLPSLTTEGMIVHVSGVDKDYKASKKPGGTLYWKMIGQFKPFTQGNASMKIEIPVKIPRTIQYRENYLFPLMDIDLKRTMNYNTSMITINMTDLYVSLYRGIVNLGGSIQAMICAEKYLPGVTTSLVPSELYASVYCHYLNWKSMKARSFTKYILLSLPELMALQWGKRYFISGVWVILDKINYELPYRGLVKIDGYTA